MSNLGDIINEVTNKAKEARDMGYTGFPCSRCGSHNTTQTGGYGTGPGSTWRCNQCGNTFERRV
jgi:transposase-like protein